MTAYSHFEGGNYAEAISASKRYLQLHPASKDAAYAQYLMAFSYYNQIPDVTRDQEQTERAVVALQELIDRYPKSEYVADARYKIQVAATSSPARRWRSGATTSSAATTPPRSTASATSSPSTRPPVTSRRR